MAALAEHAAMPVQGDEDQLVVIADDGVPVAFLAPPSPDDGWRLELDLRGVGLFWPDCCEENPRPSPPSPAPSTRSSASRPRAPAPRSRRRPASDRQDHGGVDQSGDGDADPPAPTALLRSVPPRSVFPSVLQVPNEPDSRPFASVAHPDSPPRPLRWLVELVRAGVVSASELLAAAVQAMVEEEKRGGSGTVLSGPAPAVLPASGWQTPPVAARAVGVPLKMVRAMIKTKQIRSRLRNRTSAPKQPKFLVNTDELRAAVARDQAPERERDSADEVRELARRIREKASRR